MRRFIFEDSVLLDDLNTSKDILNYLKEKKNELLVYSSLKYDELNKEIKDAKLDAFIDVMIPHINEELFNDYFTKSSFFNTIRNSKEDLIKELSKYTKIDFNGCFVGIAAEKKRIDEYDTILISDKIAIYEEARKIIQSIYYDNLKKEIIGGRKIKTLSTLKTIY